MTAQFALPFADVIIRIADACGAYGIDLGAAVATKLTYNATRPARHGGEGAVSDPITIALVGCGSRKLDRPAPARDLYTGSLFTAARAFAETCDEWRILSARFGLLDPLKEIAPYDTRLPANYVLRRQWAQGVVNRLAWEFAGCGALELIILAGADYAQPICDVYAGYVDAARCISVRTPLAGLGLGQRLAWFANERRRAA